MHRDVRSPADYIKKLGGHKQEVCGLKWNTDENLLASGGNDNRLYVWNMANDQPLLKYSDHTAAVKAIAWSPHQVGSSGTGCFCCLILSSDHHEARLARVGRRYCGSKDTVLEHDLRCPIAEH